MAAADALVGEALTISPWKEALAERDALLAVLVELREKYFVAGGEMTSAEACRLIDDAIAKGKSAT